jgi:hypothetical protein
MASGVIGREARESAAPAAETGPFVLNLCSSTTPMALAQVDLPELKRFTFFVSRRFEEGRERFRLHMGYFTSITEAEEWLNVVREIYPGAWAGEAPGKKLRARAAAAAAEQAQHALGPQPRSALPNLPPASAPVPVVPAAPARPLAPAPARAAQGTPTATPPVAARPVELKPSAPRATVAPPAASFDPPLSVPTVHAATPAPVPVAMPRAALPPTLAPPVARAAPVQPLAPIARAAQLATLPAAKPQQTASGTAVRAQSAAGHAQHSKAPTSPAAGSMGAAPSTGAKSPLPRGVNPQKSAPARLPVKAAVASAKPRPKAQPKGNAFNDSNVREVLAALGDEGVTATGQTRMMPTPPASRVAAQEDAGLTDTQVLRYLETRRSDDASGRAGEEASDTNISLLKPDDTGTRRALKEAVSQNAPVSFAVQLQWAVQPVELAKVPPLAIFSAYTLYTVEGSREGRKWYGLRLGFFSDATSAKQVAYYVRSEFASVAVVPVSPQERQRATEEDKRTSTSLALPRKTRQAPVDEFKLIDSEQDAKPAAPAAKPVAAKPAAVARPAAAAAVPTLAPPAKRPAAAGRGRVGARERKGPQTLEETLEILGAGELEIDGGRGESLNDTGVRHLRVEVQKNTPFSRLLERLSERTKKN